VSNFITATVFALCGRFYGFILGDIGKERLMGCKNKRKKLKKIKIFLKMYINILDKCKVI